MKGRRKLGVSNAIAAILVVVSLVIGAAIGFAASSMTVTPTTITVTNTVTQTKTIGTAGEVTVTTTVTEAAATVTKTETVTITSTAAATTALSGEIKIGALLPLSGTLATFGERNKAGIQLAVEEVNKYLEKLGVNWRLKLYVEDTELKPAVTLEKLQSLYAKGVRIVIGPMASSGVVQIKEYAESNNILVITQSSTAVQLAIPGDNILRLAPSDVYQAKIGPIYAKSKGVTHVILFWRGDSWGDGLAGAAKENYEKMGINVVAEIRYSPDATEFSAEVATLADKVDNLISQGVSPDKIMVHLISFEEAEMIMLSALEYPNLEKILWFGSDGTALSSKLVDNEAVAEFCTKVDFISPAQAPVESSLTREVSEKIKESTGMEADQYTYNSYDAVWLIALAILQSGSDDPQVLKKIIPDVAARLWGASGPIVLDENGDRVPESYNLAKIIKTDQGYEWRIIGKFDVMAEKIVLE